MLTMPCPPLNGQLAAVLVDAAITGRAPAAILEGLCRAMVDLGLPLSRAAIGAFLVHPLLDATLVVWRSDRGAHIDDSPRPAVRGNERWRHSPFYRMEQSGTNLQRYRLDQGEGAQDFAVLAELAAEGATDYVALRTRLAAGVTLGQGTSIFSSWVTHRVGGFTAAEIDRIRGIEPLLAVVTAAALGTATAGTLLATYLGADAAARVLSGDIERGHVEMIHAVIWYSDLAGFTQLTDKVSSAGMLPLFSGYAEILRLLNDHAEILVDAIEARGGQVLKFMGDGLLAIFRAASEEEACEAALSAWIEASGRCEELRRRRPTATHPYLALHAGDVLYGNIGGRTRLDFTVMGHAVNEASRIAALCRPLGQPVLISETFAELCPAHRRAGLKSLGRHTLRGVSRPPMLFGLRPPEDRAVTG